MQEVATAANRISSGITDVGKTVEQTRAAAADVRQAAELVNRQSGLLKGEVSTFLADIRQA